MRLSFTRTAGGGSESNVKFSGWWMAAIAFIAQNCAMGLTYGSYGTLVNDLQEMYGTSRAVAASGFSLIVLVLALLSPFAGYLLTRVSVKYVMIAGAVLDCIGYLLLTQAASIEMVLVIYAVFIGSGTCLLGILPTSYLVSTWFVRYRAKVFGFVCAPVLIFLFPMVSGYLLTNFGMTTLFMVNAVIFAAIIPLLFFVVERPEKIGQRPLGLEAGSPDAGTAAAAAAPEPVVTMSQMVKRVPFWVLSIAIGVLSGAGTMFVTHIVPLTREEGIDLQTASTFLSAFGGGGVLGAFVFGALADKIGAVNTLAVTSVLQVIVWVFLFYTTDISVLFAISALIGMCCGAIVPLHGASVSELFGREAVGPAVGLGYFLKTPFIFGAPIFAGMLRDMDGSYSTALLVHVVGFALSALLFFMLYRAFRGIGRLA